MTIREAIMAEAKTWLGTPYHHLAGVKGAGVDCAMLLVEVHKAVGLLPADFDPRPYAPQWFLHRDEEKFVAHLLSCSKRTTDPQPGDVALYRFGRTAAHGAILLEDDLLIHAYRPSRRVEITERRTLVGRLDSFWSVV